MSVERFEAGAVQREQAVVCTTTRSPICDTVPAADGIYVQAAHENFPVASRLLPASARDDLLALYGFARLTDDIGDEARRRTAVALEPMTCPPDAFRSGTDLVALEPGEEWQGAWGLRPH